MPATDLTPFVPRLVPEWITEAPEARHRSIPGTLVFTDLSGFTAMSERLAALGKVGAEELTRHLDETFTELVSVSGGLGGTMLKFGGDALLIFFWGKRHELRAARAAVEMQTTLDRIGDISTSAGDFRLRMTVGAHSGEVDYFLIGSSHRELFVCGPTATTTVEVEGRAESGEIRVSHDLARRLPAGAVDRGADPALLVRAPEVEVDAAPWPTWPVGTTAGQFVPEAVRNHVASGVELREHRQMTVGFLHLANLDEMLYEVGAGVTARHLDDLVSHIQRIFAAHGIAFVSTDVYEGGPKIICAAGAVRTFGNDDESLLRALREIVDYPSPIDLRIGVNRGHGFCGYVGPPFRRTFVTIGDVVNTAARVMSKAGSRDILSTAGPLDRSDTIFESVPLPPFEAKGKAEPLQAFRVGRVAGTRSGTDRRQLPLVGRDAELATLLDALSDVSARTGRFLEIRGETGMGKSRLIEELVSRAQMPVTAARCGRYAGSTPYFPFRTLVSELVGGDNLEALTERVMSAGPELKPYLPLLALLLGQTAPHTREIERLSPVDQRKKLQEVFAELVRTCAPTPRVWIVEDAHWLDPASADLLRFLAARAESLPLLLCVTSRTEEGGELLGADEQVIELHPLDEDASAGLVKAAAEAHLLPREISRLTERSHGNPYFLIELVEVASRERNLDHLPDSLESLVASKIDALPPADKLLLRQLAVVGSRFDPVVAEEALPGLRDVGHDRWADLDEFLDRSAVPWRFRQTLVRDTAYEALAYGERRDVHERVGTAFERHATDPSLVCELLSLHFHAAENHAKSLLYSTEAGEKAKVGFALAEAATFFGRSVESARALPDREALGSSLTQLAHAELDQGLYAQARGRYEESLEIKRQLGDMQGVAAQLSGLGLVFRQLGEYDRARSLFEESLEVLRGLEEPINLGSVLRNIGSIAWLQGDYETARDWFEQSLDVYRGEEDVLGQATSLDTLGSVAFTMGDLGAAAVRYEEAMSLFREQGEKHKLASAGLNRGNVALQEGKLDDARQYYTESLDTRRDLGDLHGVASALGNLGTVAYFAKEYDEARTHYEESLGIAREIGDQRGVSQCVHNLAEIAIIVGDLNAARDLCAEGLRIRRELGYRRGIAESLTTLGRIESDLGQDESARTHYLEALKVLQELGNKPGLAECLEAVAVISARSGDAAPAATLLGAVDGMLASSGSARTWSSETRETLEESLRETLGPSVFDLSLEVGLSMSTDRALELARGVLGEDAEAEPADRR